MAKMIQIRNVPDALHRRLKARAAMLGMSLSDYLLGEIRQVASQPTLREWLDTVQSREPTRGGEGAASAVRVWRDRD